MRLWWNRLCTLSEVTCPSCRCGGLGSGHAPPPAMRYIVGKVPDIRIIASLSAGPKTGALRLSASNTLARWRTFRRTPCPSRLLCIEARRSRVRSLCAGTITSVSIDLFCGQLRLNPALQAALNDYVLQVGAQFAHLLVQHFFSLRVRNHHQGLGDVPL